MSDYKKIVVNTKNYSVEDMLQGTQPICDTKILEGNEWSFSQDELPATVYYETTSVEVPKVYTFASDEDHVEMASGRTLREEYMGVLKTMGKEFVSADGSPITVNNGIEARLISAEIKGQTVKCISKLLKYTHDASTGRTKDVNLQLEKAKYTFSVEVTENVGNTILGFIFKDGVSDVYKNIPINGVGFFKNVIDLSTCTNNPRLYAIYATESGVSGSNKLVEQVNILYGEVNLITGLVDKGLSSTEAIISNTGEPYPIYANEEDEANKKVILIGGVGDVYDTLELKEDGSVIYTQNTKNLVLNGSENWQFESIGITKLDTTAIFGNLPESTDKVRVIGDMYKGDTWNNGWVNDNIVFMHPNGGLFIRDTSIATLEEFKAKLSTTNLIVRGSLGTPIVTHIPKEIVPSILTHKTNILEAGGAVKPSSFKVTVPTTDGIKKEYTLTPINGWKGTAKANLLQTGDIGLVLDLTIPEQFNTLITNLPNELKPKTERTVLGYNGNTPVVVKIGTDGTVKLPVTTTGVVKLDDTYKL